MVELLKNHFRPGQLIAAASNATNATDPRNGAHLAAHPMRTTKGCQTGLEWGASSAAAIWI